MIFVAGWSIFELGSVGQTKQDNFITIFYLFFSHV